MAAVAAGGPAHPLTVRAVQTVLPRQFDASCARDLDARIELRIRDPRGGTPAPLSLRIAGGELSITSGQSAGAQATAELGADDMIRLAAGSISWPALLATGRMTFSGDPFLALRFPALFRLSAG